MRATPCGTGSVVTYEDDRRARSARLLGRLRHARLFTGWLVALVMLAYALDLMLVIPLGPARPYWRVASFAAYFGCLAVVGGVTWRIRRLEKQLDDVFD